MTFEAKVYLQSTTEYREAQSWLFDLECAGRQAVAEVDGIRIAIYNTIQETIYWFADLMTDDEFVTSDFDEAVYTLTAAIVQ